MAEFDKLLAANPAMGDKVMAGFALFNRRPATDTHGWRQLRRLWSFD
jgi:hypothetical protein